MPISDSKRKADRAWRERNYDKICIQYPKGVRDFWKQEAQKRGLSLAEFIRLAVQAYLSK